MNDEAIEDTAYNWAIYSGFTHEASRQISKDCADAYRRTGIKGIDMVKHNAKFKYRRSINQQCRSGKN